MTEGPVLKRPGEDEGCIEGWSAHNLPGARNPGMRRRDPAALYGRSYGRYGSRKSARRIASQRWAMTIQFDSMSIRFSEVRTPVVMLFALSACHGQNSESEG